MPAITVENVSKRYRKGQIGYRTLREDLYDLTGRLISLTGKGKAHSYKEHIWALKDVSFQVDKGETLGIIGPNGAGKTTTLRLLAGITNPTEGRISVNGRMGVLIELAAGFHPELTGRENIYLNGAILGMTRKEIKRKFDAIVDFAEIEDFIETPVKRYSSGMMVRLGFSVAVHVDPDVLLVDEVLAVGDIAFQAKCYERMSNLLDRGCALVFVSHNMAAMQRICKRVIWLEKGRIREDGEAAEVCNAYANRMISTSARDADAGGTGGIAVEHADPDISLKSVEVYGKNSDEVNKVLVGDECTIRIVFETRRRLEKPAFLIGIRNEDNLEIAVLHSKAQGDSTDFEGVSAVKCVLQHLSLFPGVYRLRFGIGEGARPGALLYAQNAGQFQVVSDSPGWTLMRGILLPAHKWAFE